jgi:hypothetical protein
MLEAGAVLEAIHQKGGRSTIPGCAQGCMRGSTPYMLINSGTTAAQVGATDIHCAA